MKIKLAVLALIVLVVAIFSGCSSTNTPSTQTGPSCSENIAMLQTAVDKYKTDVGVFPADLQQIISDNAKNWKGPYVKEIPACPAGGKYRVDSDGRVTE